MPGAVRDMGGPAPALGSQRAGEGGLGSGGSAPAPYPHCPLQVFQRRADGSVNFFRGWEAYRDGFGKLTGEHWLGEALPPADWGAGGPAHRRRLAVCVSLAWARRASSRVLRQKGRRQDAERE